MLRSILFRKPHRLPVANEHFDDHPNDIAIRVHAYKQRIAIYEAVWVARVLPLLLPPQTRIERAECPKIPVMVLSTNGGKAFDIANFYVSDRSQFATSA